MEKVYVRLTPEQVQAIKAIAREERRHPSDQAALAVQAWLRDRQAAQDRRPVEAGAAT
jgi:hypothetical protein